MGNAGRPKLEIARNRVVTVRLTNFEFEKIEKISKKLGKYKSFAKSKTKNEFGTVYGNSNDD